MEKVARKLNKKEIDKVIVSKELHKYINFMNALTSNGIKVFDGKWLIQYLVIDIIEYLNKNKILENKDEVAILSNDLTEEVKGNLIELAKKFKKIRIITNHSEKFKKIETDYIENGIPLIITNNRKKALNNQNLIINFDFIEETINEYWVNDNAIIINLEGKLKINKKRFSGIIVTDCEVEKIDESEQNDKENLNLQEFLNDFYAKEVYEEKVYSLLAKRTRLSEANFSRFEVARKIIEDEKIKVKELFGINGKIA